MYKTIYQLKSLGTFETLDEAFKVIYNAIKKEKVLLWQMLETTIWIEAPYDIISFYDARDIMCAEGYLVDGKWIDKNEPEPASPKATPAEDRYGKDVKPEPKPLARFMAEYLSHEMIQSVNSNFCWTENNLEQNLKIWFEQALDAYESTENVKIKIEKQ